MRLRRRSVVEAALALVVAALALAAGPLRNEDVVRMIVAGKPVSEIVGTIKGATTEFDLSDEMVQELRLAGVPDSVVGAMRERQAEIERAEAASAPPRAASPAASGVPLEIDLRPAGARGGDAEGPVVVVPERLDDATARALQLGPTPEDRTVTDVAVFLACRTADHVPDQWRSKSPLGRDFVSVARHQMLDFRSGATRVAKKEARDRHARGEGPSEGGSLRLEVPASLRADVEPGVAHDLTLGVAIQVGDRFLQIAQALKDNVLPGAEGVRLDAEIHGRAGAGPPALVVRFVADTAR